MLPTPRGQSSGPLGTPWCAHRHCAVPDSIRAVPMWGPGWRPASTEFLSTPKTGT